MTETQAARWRKLAADALAEATAAKDEWVRGMLTQIAVGYDHLAKRADGKSIEPIPQKD
jgi:hypothetical protein